MLLRHSRAALPRPSPRALAALLALAALPLAACTEDTLYDGEEVTGPEVTGAPHTVSVSLAAPPPPRVEVGEALRVLVTGRGGAEAAGRIAQLGATVLVMNTARSDTVVVPLGPEAISPPAAGVVTREFRLVVAQEWVDRLRLPDTLALEVHGWAVNSAGACVAAVQDSVQKLPCADFRGARVASRTRGLQARLAVVAGTTVSLPGGTATIADMVVHNASRRVFLSNKAANRIEVLEMPSSGAPFFGQGVAVGSEPWGLGLTYDTDPSSLAGDTLMVANSGGISISFVPLGTGALREDVPRRFQIPRARLHGFIQEVKIDSLTNDTIRSFRVEHFTYADRPQFVAQDARRRLLYSAIGTQAAPSGTIRLAEWKPGWSAWDARFLFARGLPACCSNTNRAIQASGDADVAIANVDSISIEFITFGPLAGPTARITIYDHRPGSLPGDPGRLIRNPVPRDALVAIQEIAALGSDVLAYPAHKWNVPAAVEMADTTFVAVSGDHRFVAFGELSDTAAGRVVIWGAADAGDGNLSRMDDTEDIANNTSDRITGIDLNEDGSLGLARGEQASYFFGNDLRLQGLSRAAGPGGAGATLRPGASAGRELAFVGTSRSTIQVIETTHYQVIAEIPVRASIVGPLRAGPALPGQNACPPDYGLGTAGCVVARLYGVTAGGVVIVEVLKDQLPPTTAAARRD